MTLSDYWALVLVASFCFMLVSVGCAAISISRSVPAKLQDMIYWLSEIADAIDGGEPDDPVKEDVPESDNVVQIRRAS